MEAHRTATDSTPALIDAASLQGWQLHIQNRLKDQLRGLTRGLSATERSALLIRVLIDLFGHRRTAEEQQRFLIFSAPLMRLEILNSGAATNRLAYSADTLAATLRRLEKQAPATTLAVDLHYFCGFSITEIAALTNRPETVIAQELRFARAWVAAEVGPRTHQ